MTHLRNLSVLASLLCGLAAPIAAATQWPQWRGPNRDGIATETGLLKQWPAGGPRLLWSVADLGLGFGAVAIADGRLYVSGAEGETETLFAYDLDGKRLWQQTCGPLYTRRYGGARTTPTVSDDKVYVISGHGHIHCFAAKTGKPVWSVDGLKTFAGKAPRYGIAESPLLVGGKVIFTAGGTNAAIVALDHQTGATVWQTTGLSDRASFCSPTAFEHGGRTIIVTMTGANVVAVDSTNGDVLWTHPFRNQWGDHANTPIYHDGTVFVSAHHGKKRGAGSVLLRLGADGTTAEPLWTDKALAAHCGQIVRVDGHYYGATGTSWVCLKAATGEVAYTVSKQQAGADVGALTYADGMFYCFGVRRGTVALVPANPAGFAPVSQFTPSWPSGATWSKGNKCWTAPVVCDGRLYIRRDHVLMVYAIGRRK